MAAKLEITHTHFEALVTQAQAAYPLETCGLMAGEENRVRHLYQVANKRNSPVEYEMDPGEQVRAMIDLEEKGWELIGIYHSHPQGPQLPSATDVDLAYYPQAAYVIISLEDRQRPEVRAFNIVSGNVTEIALHVV
jgi:proteasome lid subunit RPN8/RPN11